MNRAGMQVSRGSRRSGFAAVAGALAALAAIPALAGAATIKVTTGKDEFGAGGTKKCALREAVQAANEDSKFGGCPKGGGADIVKLGPGRYKLSIEDDNDVEEENVEGDIDTQGKLVVKGAGAKATFINGNSQKLDERVFEQHGPALTIDGVTIHNAQDYDSSDDGGAVRNDGAGKLVFRRSRAFDNYADYDGGALATNDGPITVVGSVLTRNATGSYGGAISGYSGGGKITVINSTLSENSAVDGGGAMITGEGKLVLDRARIINNSGIGHAGGIDLYQNDGATIRRSLFQGNVATATSYEGGALSDEANDGPVLIESTTFADNLTAAAGAAIYADGETWTIRNSTFTGNEALDYDESEGEGGAIYFASGDLNLVHVTITGNRAYSGAGIYAYNGMLTLRNSILAGNRNYGEDELVEDCNEPGGDVISLGHNLIGDGSCDPIGSDLIGTSLAPLSPLLEPLSSNGGPTPTIAPLAGSPVLGKGTNCLKTDQRGHRRKKSKCDIGAFER